MPLIEALTVSAMLWSSQAAWAAGHVERPGASAGEETCSVVEPVALGPWEASVRVSVSGSAPSLSLGGLDAGPGTPSFSFAGGPSPEWLGRDDILRHLVSYDVKPGLGGSLRFDIGEAALRTGPVVSWLTPDAPREGWLRTRVVTPGWGVWYATGIAPLAVGLSTSARFVLTEQSETVVDPFTSQAHLALLLD